MELTRLKSFLAVARKGNLSAAAKELGMTQPNLGRQMTALANEVKMDLFIRHSRGMDLTVQGKEFYDMCERIVSELEQETVVIREKNSEPQGTLKIVVGIGLAERILENLHDFSAKFPKIHFHFSSLRDIYNFQIGDSDVGLIPIHFNSPDLVQHYLVDMVLRIYASPTYFKSHPHPKTLNDLKTHQLVVYTNENSEVLHSHNRILSENQTSSIYDEAFIYVNNAINMRSALLNGYGIGTYFRDRKLMDQNLLVDVFPDVPDLKVPYYYTYHKRLEGSPKIKVFHDFVQEVVRKI